jgi:hypothetical protein
MSDSGRSNTELRYYLNLLDGVIHDLSNQKQECRIAEIKARDGGVGFAHLETAMSAGFEPCCYCLGQNGQ